MSAWLLLGVFAAGASTGCALWLLSAPDLLVVVRSWTVRARAIQAVRRHGAPEGEKGAPAGWRNALDGVIGRFCRKRQRGQTQELGAAERSQCLDELPELVDVVALGLSAGVSFDAALEIYCARHQTMLAGFMADAMRSWRLGMASRKEALVGLSARMGVPAFTTFVDTVTESLEFGAPLARALAEQADSVRLARRAVLQEQIEKAPVKMLVPTGTLVLPAMLLAILGPLMSSLAVLTE